jgi:hypothetical protein
MWNCPVFMLSVGKVPSPISAKSALFSFVAAGPFVVSAAAGFASVVTGAGGGSARSKKPPLGRASDGFLQ